MISFIHTLMMMTDCTHLNKNYSFPKSKKSSPFKNGSCPTLNCNNTSHNLLMQPVVQLNLLRLSQEDFSGTKLIVITVQIQCVQEVTYVHLWTGETVRHSNNKENLQMNGKTTHTKITHTRSHNCSLLSESDFVNKLLETILNNHSSQLCCNILSAKMYTFIILSYCPLLLRVLATILLSVKISRHIQKDNIKMVLEK